MATSDDFKRNPEQYKTFEQSSQGLNASELAKKLDQLKAQKTTLSEDQKLQKQLAGRELGSTGSLFDKVERELKNIENETLHTIALLDADLKTYKTGVLTFFIGKMTNSFAPLNQQREKENQHLTDIKNKLEMLQFLKSNTDFQKGPALVQARSCYDDGEFDKCVEITKQLKVILRPFLETSSN